MSLKKKKLRKDGKGIIQWRTAFHLFENGSQKWNKKDRQLDSA